MVRKISLIRDRRTVTVYFGGETPAKDTIVHFFFRFYVCTLRTGEIVPIQRTIKLGAQSDEKGNNFIFLSAPSIVGISCASVLPQNKFELASESPARASVAGRQDPPP